VHSTYRTEITGVSGMVQTKEGDLWLNGIHGISRIAYSDFREAVSSRVPLIAQQYTQTEITGPAQSFGFPTAAIDASGRIWFNTSGLIAYVDPKNIPHNTLAPTLTVDDIEEDGQQVGEGNRVKAGTGTVRIKYFGANLFAPEKVNYQYWLHGFDKSWQDVDRRTEAVYTHLGPGTYLFEVKATNGEGVWTAPVSTTFTVLPTYYQTWWFQALCMVAGLLILWLLVNSRVRFVAAAVRMRAEERAEERVRIARELHDTLLQGFQGLLMSFHAATQKIPATHESRLALEKALASADHVILEGRDRVNRLRSSRSPVKELEAAIQELADDLAALSRPEFALERTGIQLALNPEVSEEVYYIAREALTNSYRHSGATRVVAAVDYGKRGLRLELRDNGKGFDKRLLEESETHGHWGFRGMAERAQRIGADFSYRSAPGEGTQVTVVVPASRAYADRLSFHRFFNRITELEKSK
jgi:signal transduction histidine kinase